MPGSSRWRQRFDVVRRRVLRPVAARPLGTLAPFAACVLVLGLQQFVWTGLLGWKRRPRVRLGQRGRLVAPDRRCAHAVRADRLGAVPIPAAQHEYPAQRARGPGKRRFRPIAQPSARRPHIFLFVVDSLRRDYLSPYNAAVSFTPSFGRFAAESTVFERAFTRYGATGLAVPSIWAGGLLLHKQYVTPFAPMNTLAKLLEAEKYARWMSMEHIVETIVPPSRRARAARRRPACEGPPVLPHAAGSPGPAGSADGLGHRPSFTRCRRTSTSRRSRAKDPVAGRRRRLQRIQCRLCLTRAPDGCLLRRVRRRSESARVCTTTA